MAKKLLLKVLTFWALILTSAMGWGQECTGTPTVNIYSSASDNTICAGESVTFTAEVKNAGASPKYQWQVNGVNRSGETKNTFTVSNLGNNHSVTLVLTADCEGAIKITSSGITTKVNSIPSAPTISGDNSVCAGDDINLSASAISGATYNWSGPGGFTYTGKEVTRTGASSAMAGTYTLTATVNGCTSTERTFIIDVNSVPGAPTAGNGGEVCVGGTIELTANNITGASYAWTGPNGFTSNLQNPEISNATSGMSGTYSVTATVNECTGPAGTTMVVVNSAPSAPKAGNKGEVCVGETIELTATTISGASYSWSGPDGFSSSLQNPTVPNATLAKAGTYRVIATVEGCPSDEATTSVVVNAIPTPPTVSNNGPICLGDAIHLTASSITGATYSWSGPNGFTSNQQNPILSGATLAMEGEYELTVTVNGCESTIAKTTVVLNKIPTITATAPGERCGSGTVTLEATASDGTINWYSTATGGNSLGTGTSFTTPSISSTTSYFVDATANGCTTGTRIEVIATVKNIPTITNISPGNVCNSGTVTLGATASAGTINWYSGATGGPILGTGTSFTTPSLESTTTYYVDATADGCTSPSRTPVDATVTTVPSITSTIPGSICGSGTVELKATASAGIVHWFTSPTGGIPVATGNSFAASPPAANNNFVTQITYHVEAILDGCSNSERIPVTATRFGGNTPAGISNNSISGPASVCPPAEGIIYTVAPVDRAESYVWSLPPGFEIVEGLGTNSITVNVTTSAKVENNQKITVYAKNPCGNGGSREFSVSVNNFAGVDAGENIALCLGESHNLTNTLLGNATSINEWVIISRPSGTSGTGEITGGPWNSTVQNPFIFNPSSAGTYILQTTTNTATGSCPEAKRTGVDEVTITVNAPPEITTQPSTTSPICSGTAATFSVIATGTGLTYQWQKNGADISGATSSTFEISSPTSDDNGDYTVIVSGESPCETVTSQVSNLVVNDFVVIEEQPNPEQILCSGSTATLNVSATGTDLHYQWKKDGIDITGETSSSLTLNNVDPDDSGEYTVLITGTSPCEPLLSEKSILTVNQVIEIVEQPVPLQTLCSGSNAEFEITATGTGLTYQWKKNGANIPEATSATLTLSNISTEDSGNYTVEISGKDPCESKISATSVLEINEIINIDAQPTATQILCSGSTASFSVEATGTGLTYQWSKDGTPLSGETAATLSLENVSVGDSGTYTVHIEGDDPCSPVTSDDAILTVHEGINISQQPESSQILCVGDTANIQVTATGTGLSYQWHKNGTILTGENADSLVLENLSIADAGEYTVLVSGTDPCEPVLSEKSVLVINETTEIIQNLEYPDPVLVCAGFPIEFTVEATGTDISYEWFRGSTSTGVSNSTLSITNVSSTDAGIYTVEVTGACGEVTSKQVELIVNQSITIDPQPTPEIVSCEGSENISLSIGAEGDIYSFVWRKDEIPLTEDEIYSGVNSPTLLIKNQMPEHSGSYDVVISSPAESCSQIISNPSVVTINSKSADPEYASASKAVICSGDSTELSLNEGGGGTGEEIRWYLDPDDEDFIGTGNDFLVSPLNTTVYYGRYEDPTGCGAPSAFKSIEITVNNDSTIELTSDSGSNEQIVCINSPITSIVYKVAGGATGASIEITEGEFLDGLEAVFNEGLFTISGTPTKAGAFSYTVTTEGPCDNVSLSGTIEVNPAPVVTIDPENQNLKICSDGSAYNITAGAFEENTTSIEWSVPDGTGSIANATSLTEATFTPAEGVTEVTITLKGYGLNGCSDPVTTTKDITIQPLPTITSISFGEGTSGFCDNKDSSAPLVTGTNAFENGTFSWAPADGETATNVLNMNSETGQISAGSDPGVYDITYSTPSGAICGVIQKTTSITISKLPDATFGYSSEAFCKTSGGKPEPIISGDTGGIFTASAGLVIDSNGVIDVASSTANDPDDESDAHTVTYTFASNGICDEVTTTVEVRIDGPAVGGELTFEDFGRLFTTCELTERNTGLVADLMVQNYKGKIEAWKYKTASGTIQIVKNSDGSNFTNPTLPGTIIEGLRLTETTVFQVEISSGACTSGSVVSSQSAILSVISSDIEPTPVSADKDIICVEDRVILTAGSGYEAGAEIGDGGNFDNSSITNHGWKIIKSNGGEGNFNSSADNGRANDWLRTNPVDLWTADIEDPGDLTKVRYASSIGNEGNKGIAIVSGPYNGSKLITPKFDITAMDQALLKFDQAYNLTEGASIAVEITKDGGATWELIYYKEGPANSGHANDFGGGDKASRPENKIEVNLGDYMGLQNLQIRFHYKGVRDGDVWALDGITIPDGPANIGMVWKDHTGDTVEIIGTNFTETWYPKEIGWNISDITTTLEYSNGSCETAVHSEQLRVFVFDKYTTSITAELGSCGNFTARLSATAIGTISGEIQNYPTPDGYIGRWKFEGAGDYTIANIEPTDTSDPWNNPEIIFIAEDFNDFSASWELIPQEKDSDGNVMQNPGCPTVPTPFDIIFEECIALDFDGEDDHIIIDHPYDDVLSIEAWIRPEGAGGTIISGANFHFTTPSEVTINSRWYHVAISGGKLYVDGIDKGPLSLGKGGDKTVIGAEWADGKADNFFNGWIEEVRLWKKSLTVDQIRFMMNQRLVEKGAQMGEQIPMDVPDGLIYSDLAGYYRLISAEPEPLPGSPVVYLVEDMPANGITPDRAENKAPGRLINMETNQENTAPLPYYSGSNGVWGTDATWLRPEVWDPPHTGSIEWNIVRTSHDITSGRRDIALLGLISEDNTLDMEGDNPVNSWITGGSGNELYISHYLKLDGTIDLNGESQLLQPEGSIVDGNSKGVLYRDQQGTASSYNYNYWSSPVSSGANNAPYTVKSVLMDGSHPTPGPLDFGYPYAHADGVATNPRKISTYWLFKFHGTADNYFEWSWVGDDEATLNTGEGWSMKGTTGSAAISDAQNYTFRGLPNNGDITPGVTAANQNYLIGNPYPSAIDAHKFIADNLASGRVDGENVFNGTIYFWSHFANKTHYLQEYIGGYAAFNLGGGVKAVAVDDRINATDDEGGQVPQQFIPVGQAFFINTMLDETLKSAMQSAGLGGVNGGLVTFKNSQRVFIKESDTYVDGGGNTRPKSVFHSQERKEIATGTNNSSSPEVEQNKIWLKFKSPKGYHRQILVTADHRATDNFDLGFDAPMIDNNIEDMYWYFNNYQFVIQGVPDFDIERVLDLGFHIEEKGTLNISIDDLENIPDEMNIYVADSLLQVVHDLRVKPYITESEAGTFTNRFKLVFQDKTQIDQPEEPVVINDGPFEVMYVTGTRNVLVRNPELLQVDRIYLNNMLGQQVHVFYDVPEELEVELPVKRFSAGVYIVKVHYEGGIMTKKVILE